METLGSDDGHVAELPQLQVLDAIDVLKNRSDGEILAWLAFARSIEDFQYKSSTVCLPHTQVNAISILRDWSDPAIFHSLRLARSKEKLIASQHDSFWQLDHSCFGLNPFRNTTNPDRSWECGRSPKKRRLNQRVSKTGNPSHLYWCTVYGLEDPHSYKTSDPWKKHEKEHEFTFKCLPTCWLETSNEGVHCALCGESSSDEQHFKKHKLDQCLNASDGLPTFKRRYQLVSHLQDQHACVNTTALAEKWRFRSQKQAWSCGFCIALFTSVTDRLKHIGVEHFEKHETLHEWSSTKIIQGLLLQAEINEAWCTLLNTMDPFSRENLSWTIHVLPRLQPRLEFGVTVSETAEELARVAYELAEFDWDSHEAASKEVIEAGNNFRPPPNRAPRNKASGVRLPTAKSATAKRSWYSHVHGGTPSLYTGASMSERQSDTESTQGDSLEMCYDEGGLADMQWDNDDDNNTTTKFPRVDLFLTSSLANIPEIISDLHPSPSIVSSQQNPRAM